MIAPGDTRDGPGINGSIRRGRSHAGDDRTSVTGTTQHRQAMGSLTAGGTRRARAVALYVYEPADVDLTISEMLRLSRLAHSTGDGYVLEHHGDLLRSGTTRLRLEVGVYHFKSVNDVRLRIHPREAVLIVTPRAVADDTTTGDIGCADE